MKVKIKKLHEDAVVPKYAKKGDAGIDLVAVEVYYEEGTDNIVYKTGLAFEIPEGYFGMLVPRSSVTKKDLYLSNSVGIIDSGYRGEVLFKYSIADEYWSECEDSDLQEDLNNGKFSVFLNAESAHFSNEFASFAHTMDVYGIGERVGQIIILPYPQIEFEEVEELESSDRGEGGFGSTGK